MKGSAMTMRAGLRAQACVGRNSGLRTLGLKTRQSSVRCGSTAASGDLKKTPLYDFHVANGGKLVPFAGYHLPVQYGKVSLTDSHKFTRSHASVFDVSHMVQHIFKGPAAAAFLERVSPSSWHNLEHMQSKLTTLLWPGTGGIVDDCVVTRLGEDEYYVVTNGACFEKDCKYLDEELGKFGGGVEWTRLDNSGLFALQGPKSAEILKKVLATDVDLSTVYFGTAFHAQLKTGDGGKTHPVLISRAGYTGEDGFELSFNGRLYDAFETTEPALRTILEAGGSDVAMAGLGARDSLRLEAGMCLYGHDLDDTTTPVEAALSWIIPPERRAAGGFHGAEVIIPQLTPKSKGGAGVSRRRVGLVVEGAPAREGADIEVGGEKVGVVTSGSPSPTLGKNVAMGYVRQGKHQAGTEVDVVVRGRKRQGVISKMPFVPTNLVRKPAQS